MKTPDQQAPQSSMSDRAQHRRRVRSRFRFRRFSPIIRLLSILGPGLIAANAGNDAGGVATYSSAGASYGYNLLWALAVTAVFVAIVQEMCARMGTITGKGLADLIREEFGVRWTVLLFWDFSLPITG